MLIPARHRINPPDERLIENHRMIRNRPKCTTQVRRKLINLDMVVNAVMLMTGITFEQMQLKTRKKHILEARQWVHYFANLKKIGSLEYIGLQIGNKDHATVLHSCKVINNYLETDPSKRLLAANIERYLN